MTPIQYNIAKEKLYSIWHLNPPIEQIAKYLKIMHHSLCDENGFLCEGEILAKMVNDTSAIGLSKTQIKQLLSEEY